MFNAAEFHKIVSGQRRDAGAMLWRTLFRLAEVPYGAAVSLRNRRYDRSRSAAQHASVPVISVGNLTTGGTGKTPMVEWLARWYRERGMRVTLISRGYGAQRGSLNDEARELQQKLPDVPHLQNPNRVAAAKVAVEKFDCQLILLDDAFQHRRIHRDLDIVLLDAIEPFGYGHLLPRGLLREPVSSLARADVIALTRADMVDAARRAEIRQQALRHAPDAIWLEVTHRPRGLLASSGQSAGLDLLNGKTVGAFCGVGNPAGFRHTLESCGAKIVDFKTYPDHYRFERADIEQLCQWSDGLEVDTIVCTHKDLVKISVDQLGRQSLWAVAIGLEIVSGQESLETKLQGLCIL